MHTNFYFQKGRLSFNKCLIFIDHKPIVVPLTREIILHSLSGFSLAFTLSFIQKFLLNFSRL